MRIWSAETKGEGYVNRPKAAGRSKRRWKRLCGKSSWYQPRHKDSQAQADVTGSKRSRAKKQNIQIESVLYVVHTRDSELKKEVQKREDNLLRGRISGRIKVVEKLGPTIRSTLSNPNPWKGGHCGRQGCPPCSTKEGSCRQKNVLYTIVCLTCGETGARKVYQGESHRTLYERASEHWEGLKNQTEESVLTRHWRECHEDRASQPEFRIKLVGTCRTSTERQIKEALLINSEDSDCLINNKSEWGQNPVPRQATEFKDRIWEDREDPEGQQRQQARTRVETESSDFNSQFRQRRKVTRDSKRETERQEPVLQTRNLADMGETIQMTSRDIRKADSLRELVQTGANSTRKKRVRTDFETGNRRLQEVATMRDIRDMLRTDSQTSGLVNDDI